MFRTSKKIPKFNAGEIVKIKPREQIIQSINTAHLTDGCLFTDQMWQYCGKTFPILRVVNNFFDEHKKRSLTPRSPIYLLKDIYCEGKIDHFPQECNHGCLLLWHEDWLEKVK